MTKEFTIKFNERSLQYLIIAVLAVLLLFNILGSNGGKAGSNSVGIVSASEIIPNGVPVVYGVELGVSYDDVSPNNQRLADATINKLSAYEDEVLTGELLTRYIKIGGSISCEYCCGAQSIIFDNGERACGCAHSYAMRGLAKYLLLNHADMTDYEILGELGKWKVLFFPGIHEQKASVMIGEGIDYTDFVNLASNKYHGIENGVSSDSTMVGGC
ncbi:hypothetical protein COU61_01880 [Candidatus Pacearchaeota archaeon CG10_big_fil_rev_8_21_14_0_10_35_13]|nr:MAG: hypothetical protein COU61_01880 [Candidatus Pacearchaeota archaeon CG10_big_fil_rev_8_21_14_0_10_35_13]